MMRKKRGLWVMDNELPEGFDILQAIRDDREKRTQAVIQQAGFLATETIDSRDFRIVRLDVSQQGRDTNS